LQRAPCTETIRFLTLDELGRLLTAARGSVRDRALFLLAYRLGLRAD
jgi:integrase